MLKPLNYNVIVKQINVDTKTSSGLLLSEAEQDAPIRGVVLATAVDKIKEGDVVVFRKYAPTEFDKDGTLIIDFEDILAIDIN